MGNFKRNNKGLEIKFDIHFRICICETMKYFGMRVVNSIFSFSSSVFKSLLPQGSESYGSCVNHSPHNPEF